MTGYRALAVIAERELQLVRAGDLDSLPALHAQREALVAALPGPPPATAGPALQRAAELQGQVTAALGELVEKAGAELRRVSHGRSAMHGYAPPVERHKLVDQAG